MDSIRLEKYLAARLPSATDIAIERLARTGSGASRESWLVDAAWTQDGKRSEHPLIIRRDPTASVLETDRRVEFGVLEAVGKIGIPVPRMYWLEQEPQWLDRPFLVMERVAGVAPQVVFPAEESEESRRAITSEFVSHLACIHRADWRALGIDFIPAPASGSAAGRAQVDQWSAEYSRSKLEERPILAAALQWLEAHIPGNSEIVLVHADYRAGNFLYAGGHITAILDWEMAHLGDPMEDLAWAVLSFWSSGGLCQGLCTRAEMIAGYDEAGGMPVDEERLFFYEVLGAVKMAVISLTGVKSYCDGLNCEPVQALVGFMVPRLEADLIQKLQI